MVRRMCYEWPLDSFDLLFWVGYRSIATSCCINFCYFLQPSFARQLHINYQETLFALQGIKRH